MDGVRSGIARTAYFLAGVLYVFASNQAGMRYSEDNRGKTYLKKANGSMCAALVNKWMNEKNKGRVEKSADGCPALNCWVFWSQ